MFPHCSPLSTGSVWAWWICRWATVAAGNDQGFSSSHRPPLSLHVRNDLRESLLSNISTLRSSIFHFYSSSAFFSPPSLVQWPLCFLALSPFSSGPGPSWPYLPWVIYHGPGGEPLGLQAPVSPCNRLFVAPSKQVSDQQKSIKAWWAFLSQLGSGHWAALCAAPRALCVAAVRWHRSPQD